MTIVQSKIVTPDGSGAPGWVVVRLVGPGLQPDSRVSVLAPLAFRTLDDGTWSRDLLPNTSDSPYYVVTEQPDQGIPRQNLIHVEPSTSSVWLGTLVVRIPLPVGMDGLPYRGPDGQPGPPGSFTAGDFGAAVAAQFDAATDPARVQTDNLYEKLVSRLGATAGQVPTLRDDGTLGFASLPTISGGAPGDTYTDQDARAVVIGLLTAGDGISLVQTTDGKLRVSAAYVGGGFVFAGNDPATPRPTVPTGMRLLWLCTSRPAAMADEDVFIQIGAVTA